ncbi:MAG: ABC transporter substrate-binding protein [Bacillota bacterium]
MFKYARVLTVVALALVLAIGVIGCAPKAAPAPTAKKWKIGFDIYYAGNTWSVQSAEEFKAAAKRHTDVIEQVFYTESEGKAEKQIANIEDLISKKVDAIIMSPISGPGASKVIDKAVAAGIKVFVTGNAGLETDKYTACVTVDDKAFGTAGAEWLVKAMGEKGNIIALNGIAGIQTSALRFQGAKEVFDKYPGIKVIGQASADWDYAKAKMAAANLLAANPQIDGVWSQGGEMTRGAVEAFQAAGRKLVPMTAEDNNGFLKVWKTLKGIDKFDSIACSKPTWLTAECLEVALKALKGETITKVQVLPVPTITAADLDKYAKADLPDSLWCNTRLSAADITALFSKTK